MPFWQRLLITMAGMLAASFVADLLWRLVFDLAMPSYLAGIIGGLTAIPVWEFLKRVGPSKSKQVS